jgi:hypothetical protein
MLFETDKIVSGRNVVSSWIVNVENTKKERNKMFTLLSLQLLIPFNQLLSILHLKFPLFSIYLLFHQEFLSVRKEQTQEKDQINAIFNPLVRELELKNILKKKLMLGTLNEAGISQTIQLMVKYLRSTDVIQSLFQTLDNFAQFLGKKSLKSFKF